MNFPLFQQLNKLTGLLDGSLIEPWRLMLLLSLPLVTQFLLPFLWRHYKKEQLYRRLPSPVTSSLLGRIFGLGGFKKARAQVKNLPMSVGFGRILEHLVRPMRQAGERLFLIRLGPFRKITVVLNGEIARAVLGSSKHLEKAPEYLYIRDNMGDILFAGRVAKWSVLRKLVEPAFHLKILHMYFPAMNAHSRVLCQLIESKMDASTGRALLPDIRPFTDNCILDILCETTMGTQLNSQTEGSDYQSKGGTPTTGQLFNEYLVHFFDLVCERLAKPWLHPTFLYRLSGLSRRTNKYITNARHFVDSVISKRMGTLGKAIEDCATVEQATARLTDGTRLSFLDLLLVSHLKGGEKALTLSEIEDEVFEMMLAGLATSSTTLQMTLLLLGLHQDKQALIHQELDAIFGDDTERHICLDDLRQMTYLEMCLKETLRLYPGAPLVGRTLSEDLQMDKYLVPGGATVYFYIGAINRDPEVWTQAEDYLPERFSPDSAELGSSKGNLVFSVGPRNCLGSRFAMLNLKVILATLLRQYSVRSLTAPEDVQLGIFLIMKAHSPISIEFTKRT